jgi:hypothetical protein
MAMATKHACAQQQQQQHELLALQTATWREGRERHMGMDDTWKDESLWLWMM